MMDQENIGNFIAAMRKEKKLTQKQFAEILGVNDRSISRWENGYCMPDLSLLQNISEELDISVSELLNGRRIANDEEIKLNDTIDMMIELSNKEKQQKAKKINYYFIAGMVCFLIANLHYQCNILSYISINFEGNIGSLILTIFAVLFEFSGFYHNQHYKTLTKRELQLLVKSKSKRRIQMKTAQEMLHFAGKYYETDKKQYKLAFSEIESCLKDTENVLFSAAGSSYTKNELPMMYYAALAVTKDRIIIAGERMKGMIFTSFMSESFPVSEITAISILNSIPNPFLVIRTKKDELKIEEDPKTAKIILKELQSTVHNIAK